MTSTPHFALAQHPETGEWTLMRWVLDSWHSINGDDSTHWHPTRTHALYAAHAYVRENWGALTRDIWLETLDRLIAHERNMAAGDEAAVQTIEVLT